MATLPPLAEASDLAAWVGQDIPVADPRAGAVLSAASALVRSYTGQTWVEADALTDVPDIVNAVVVQVAARVWLNPAGLESVTLDDGTRRWGSRAGSGVVLTDADKDALAGFRETGASTGIGSVSLTGGSYTLDSIYVPTGPPPSGPPFPWYAADDPLVQ